jgi:hypothetical protein
MLGEILTGFSIAALGTVRKNFESCAGYRKILGKFRSGPETDVYSRV